MSVAFSNPRHALTLLRQELSRLTPGSLIHCGGTRARMCSAITLTFAILLTACGGKKPTRAHVPPPPVISQPSPKVAAHPQVDAEKSDPESEAREGAAEERPAASGDALPDFANDAKPLFTETGTASWYGPPYHNRRGSNGKIYDMNALTAAHRTLPLGSIVRVTNVTTGNQTLLRITDRGPFIEGRILDLSLAAAKKIDVWGPGLAKIKLEVLQAPAPLDTGGRWAVQIGAFTDEDSAAKLQDHLERRYRTAKVLKFPSPTGDWWVRVRVAGDDRRRAVEVAHDTGTNEGAVFLVRLD